MTGNRDSRQTVTGDSDRVWWYDGSDGRLLQVKVPTSELSFLNFLYGFFSFNPTRPAVHHLPLTAYDSLPIGRRDAF
jgi:hypothetical protein